MWGKKREKLWEFPLLDRVGTADSRLEVSQSQHFGCLCSHNFGADLLRQAVVPLSVCLLLSGGLFVARCASRRGLNSHDPMCKQHLLPWQTCLACSCCCRLPVTKPEMWSYCCGCTSAIDWVSTTGSRREQNSSPPHFQNATGARTTFHFPKHEALNNINFGHNNIWWSVGALMWVCGNIFFALCPNYFQQDRGKLQTPAQKSNKINKTDFSDENWWYSRSRLATSSLNS